MHLVIQVPCFDEAATLVRVLGDLPRVVAGFERVSVLVVDDGSSDDTSALARENGADRVVRHVANRGLARAFQSGIEAALRMGADVIVNTDGDHQYAGSSIPDLVRPIVEGAADIVIGSRSLGRQLSFTRRGLSAFGSFLVRRLSGTDVPDAVSGLRAFSRQAALRLDVVSNFSYTIETLIQAGQERLRVVSVPVEVNPPTRDSRLYRHLPQFLFQSALTLLRTYAMYRPLRLFFGLGLLLFVAGALPVGRFVVFYLRGEGGGHVQSLVLGGVLLVFGCLAFVGGLLADLVAFNRRLIQTQLRLARERTIGADDRRAAG